MFISCKNEINILKEEVDIFKLINLSRESLKAFFRFEIHLYKTKFLIMAFLYTLKNEKQKQTFL